MTTDLDRDQGGSGDYPKGKNNTRPADNRFKNVNLGENVSFYRQFLKSDERN